MENDFISRNALFEKIQPVDFLYGHDEDAPYYGMAVDACDIEDAPAVDAVQVVRCKNCRHYDEHFNPNTKNYCYVDGGPIHRIMPPDGFCSDGERKEK